ncbi:2-acylglycerol O-acyltransferase 2-A [Dermatophagoides farinae]|uniref:2-acylglycerol O-acyltransferase 2-A n=1 Tax=Dermatophagoides farinae TaxID=6954 RepID=UPI003F5F6081
MGKSTNLSFGVILLYAELVVSKTMNVNMSPTFAYWLHYSFYTIVIITIPVFYLPLLLQLNPLAIAYLIWYIYDFPTCDRGSRPWPWLRSLGFWSYFTDYFPIRLIRTTALPLSADRNYIFACHPHGIFSIATVHSLTTDGQQFSRLFPGLDSHMVTVSQQFWLPFYREILLALGYCSAKAQSIEYILKRKKSNGQVVAIMIGGTREAIECSPQQLVMIVKKRRGFLRLALKNRASIVPVISFGENDLYHNVDMPNWPWIESVQETIKSLLGFPFKLFYGNCLLFPLRKPVWTIVGEPILIDEEICQPTEQDIDHLQKQYIEALRRLYEQYKHQCNGDCHIQLVIK